MLLTADKHVLEFIKPAKTSRGSYAQKEVVLLHLFCDNKEYVSEVAPLVDLSVDGQVDLMVVLKPFLGIELNEASFLDLLSFCESYPSLRFGLYALWRKQQAKSDIWVNSSFTRKEAAIEINGLVWMNDIESMLEEADKKVSEGFKCIKFKVGALDFDAECRMLETFRKKHNSFSVEIRLDANGAFPEYAAMSILKDLSRFDIHSIEQPIATGKYEDMQKLCRESKIKIALDEELIGIKPNEVRKLLNLIKPQFIILKPTLLGGFDHCDLWIREASQLDIAWWSTSALEGNIGLFDIAQWVSSYNTNMPQGLGTGSLFVKNFPQNTRVDSGYLYRL